LTDSKNGVDETRTRDLLRDRNDQALAFQYFQVVTSDKRGQIQPKSGNRGNQWQPNRRSADAAFLLIGWTVQRDKGFPAR